MAENGWISINEYANKYELSVSTLRRRIKRNQLVYKLVQNKYWIKDVEPTGHTTYLDGRQELKGSLAPKDKLRTEPNQDDSESLSQASLNNTHRPPTPSGESVMDASFFSMTQGLLGEIKKAYMQVLAEKDEQIRILKSEVSDLHTLVKALEDSHQRLTVVSEVRSEQGKSESKAKDALRDLTTESLLPFLGSDPWLEVD